MNNYVLKVLEANLNLSRTQYKLCQQLYFGCRDDKKRKKLNEILIQIAKDGKELRLFVDKFKEGKYDNI